MASTCSRCGRRRAARAAGSRGSPRNPINSMSAIDNVKVWTGTLGGPEFAQRRGGDRGGRGRLPRDDRNKKILDMLKFRVPVKAGSHLVQVYFAAKTSAYRRRPVRPVAASRSLPGWRRRAEDLQRDDHRPSAAGPRRSATTIRRAAACSDLPARRRPQDEAVREEDHLDAGAPRVPPSRNRRRSSGAADALSRRRGQGRVRGGHRDGASQHPRQPEVPVPVREPSRATAAPNTPYRISDLDLASRLSFFLWSSIPDDELAGRGGEEDASQARGAAAAGAADARGSAVAGARGELRRPVAAHPQCGRCISRVRKCCSTSTTTCVRRSSKRRSCSSRASSARIAASSICWMPITRS